MEALVIAESKVTPRVQLDLQSKIFEISGNLFPENSADFFNPILTWLKAYGSYTKHPIHLDLRLNYLNSSSLICVRQLLAQLAAMQAEGIPVQINWYFDSDDEDILKTGEFFKQISKLPFQFHPCQN